MQKESGQEYIIVAFTANAVSGAKKMFMEEGFDAVSYTHLLGL